MNKTLFVLSAVLALSVSASASNRYTTRFVAEPVTLNHAYGSLQVSLFDVCLNGDAVELKVGAVSVCTKSVTYQNGATCLERKVVTPSTPVVSNVSSCKNVRSNGGLQCVPTQQVVNYAQPVSYAIYETDHTARVSQSSQVAEYYVGTGLHTILSCTR